MKSVALKGLAARKVRALLTALAVVIGVAMVSGTFILTDTMLKSFNGLFSESTSETDAVIGGKEIVKSSTNGTGITIPASLLDEVRALPQVESAGGQVSPQEANPADIIGDDGEAVAPESVGGSYDEANARFSPFKFKTGQPPHGAGQVAIDAGTARKHHYKVGDSVVVSTLGKQNAYTISGTVSYGSVDSLGFASIAVWDVPTTQKLMHREGRYDAISVAAKKGTSPAQLVEAIKPHVPANLQVQDAEKQAEDDASNLNDSLSTIRMVLLGFGAIALLVGAFVIFNTLSITVAQRTREFATLRTLGASRKQIKRSVKLEGLTIGLVASTIGLFFGLGIAKGMVALFSALGVELPDGGTVIAQRTVIVSLLLGTSVTLLASILPARRATRIPPIAAVREGSTLPPSRLAAHSATSGAGVMGAALAAISAGLFGGVGTLGVVVLLGAGVLGLFVVIALLAPRMVKPLARVVGWPARRVGGVAGELAGANAVRNPSRTASTAAALMIGLTLVTVVASLGAGVDKGLTAAIDDQLHAGWVVAGDEGLPFRASDGDKLATVPGVQQVSHVRSDTALVQGEELDVSGIDPATIAHFYEFSWTGGASEKTLGQLGTDGAIVSKTYAKDQHLLVGGKLSLQSPSGAKRTLIVRGIYDPPSANPLLGDVSLSQAAFDKAFAEPRNSYTFLDADARAAAELQSVAGSFNDAELHTGEEYPEAATKDLQVVMAMLYVLLGFSVIVSLFGMVNTMVLSVFERTREIGTLRTIGLTRRQTRRMIRHETIITALIGTTLGLGLGLVLSWLVTQAASMDGLPFTVPAPTLVAFALFATVAGVGAAIMPARRASRLDVLEALHYE